MSNQALFNLHKKPISKEIGYVDYI